MSELSRFLLQVHKKAFIVNLRTFQIWFACKQMTFSNRIRTFPLSVTYTQKACIIHHARVFFVSCSVYVYREALFSEMIILRFPGVHGKQGASRSRGDNRVYIHCHER